MDRESIGDEHLLGRRTENEKKYQFSCESSPLGLLQTPAILITFAVGLVACFTL